MNSPITFPAPAPELKLARPSAEKWNATLAEERRRLQEDHDALRERESNLREYEARLRAWLQRLDATPEWVANWLDHQRRDGYWQQGSVSEDYAAIRCPVYAIGGWADAYRNAVPRLWPSIRPRVPAGDLKPRWK